MATKMQQEVYMKNQKSFLTFFSSFDLYLVLKKQNAYYSMQGYANLHNLLLNNVKIHSYRRSLKTINFASKKSKNQNLLLVVSYLSEIIRGLQEFVMFLVIQLLNSGGFFVPQKFALFEKTIIR